MSFYGWRPYVSVAQRRNEAEKVAAKAKKSGSQYSPVASSGRNIANTFWGKAWCDNLESYSDYANRLPRGRTYVRNGSVVDLQLDATGVKAKVMGSSLYDVTVKVSPVAAAQWQAIGKDCAGSIDSLVELLQGKLSTAVMQRICTKHTGLFPAPSEMKFNCSCPDWADMCKHVAAVLYGVGVRLDEKPELLFSLRGVDAKDLVGQADGALVTSKKGLASGKVLDDAALADVFGLEMDDGVPPPPRAPAKKVKPVVARKTTPTVPVASVVKAKAKAKVTAKAKSKPTAKSTAKLTVSKKKIPKTPTSKKVASVSKAPKPKVAKPPVTKAKALPKVAATTKLATPAVKKKPPKAAATSK